MLTTVYWHWAHGWQLQDVLSYGADAAVQLHSLSSYAGLVAWVLTSCNGSWTGRIVCLLGVKCAVSTIGYASLFYSGRSASRRFKLVPRSPASGQMTNWRRQGCYHAFTTSILLLCCAFGDILFSVILAALLPRGGRYGSGVVAFADQRHQNIKIGDLWIRSLAAAATDIAALTRFTKSTIQC